MGEDKDLKLEELQLYMDKYGVEYFSAREVTYLRREEDHVVPPKRLWDNMIVTARCADIIRRSWGGPILVYSGYRPEWYNDRVNGADGSQHLFFKALDLAPQNGEVESFRKFMRKEAHRLRKELLYNLGVGYYSWGCHIDTNAKNRARNRNFGPLF